MDTLDRTMDRNTFGHAPAAAEGTLAKRLRLPLLIGVPVLVAVFGAGAYLAQEPYVSTDDAFVRTAKEAVNARVAGQVVDIAVKDNQHVRKGQLLFRLDPQPYQIAVDQAAARLDNARLQIEALKATYRQQSPSDRACRPVRAGAGAARSVLCGGEGRR
jgi:membrane fusion protein (multidrug efflux system)